MNKLRSYNYRSLRAVLASCAVLLMFALLGGCASTAEGITRALVDTGKEPAARQCDISGAAFGGLEARLDNDLGELSDQTVRVVLVHGIGTHEAEWSVPIIMRLAAQLKLNSLDKDVKKIQIASSKFAGEQLGWITIRRFFDASSSAELIAYELSWSEITREAKRELAFDTSAYYSDRRAQFNKELKVFLNDRLLDPVAYLGRANGRILGAAAQAFCFASLPDWKALPSAGAFECSLGDIDSLQHFSADQLVYITHSLGSRIVTDVLQQEAAELRSHLNNPALSQAERELLEGILEALQRKSVRLYMMANQLPLFDAALPAPRVVNQIPAYCAPNGGHYDERILQDLSVVAFSDPNDPLSYALPLSYANDWMDSRLCPSVVNVSISVTDVLSPLGLVEIAPPLEAHAGYAQDEIVLDIIAGGIGTGTMRQRVSERCNWTNIE